MKRSRQLWTDDDIKRARQMRAAGHFYSEIDKALGRRSGSTQQRLEIAGNGSGQVRSYSIPDDLLAERETLSAARDQRTLTQDFCGDPPPGYSALYGKTGQR